MLVTPLLPYPNFRQSVACYSDALLEETFKLVVANRCMFDLKSSELHWEQQDMIRFWKGRKQAFIRIGLMCADEAKQRGVGDSEGGVRRLAVHKKGKHWPKPLWAGWERLHTDHRAVLLHRGEVARAHCRVSKRNGHPKNWLYRNGWNNLDNRPGYHLADLNRFLDDEGFAPLEAGECPNHYRQFNWAEEPNGEFQVWPPSHGDWYARTD